MELIKKEKPTKSIRISAQMDGQEIGYAYLCLAKNDAHEKPFGLIEYVFIQEEYRSQGFGTELINELIAEAKRQGCYKLIATSRYERPKVHELYLKFGFQDWGKEFRMDFQ